MIPRLHLVTDDAVLQQPHFYDTAVSLLEALQRDVALHIRGPGLAGGPLHDLAARFRGVAEEAGATLLVNDRVDVALAARVPAVQLGARSLPAALVRARFPAISLIGVSAHSATEAAAAEREGANFVLAGSIYATVSHPGAQPGGVDLLQQCTRSCRLPVIAIGGIDASRVAETRAAGAYGVAVIRAVWNAADPLQSARELARMLSL